MLKGEAEFQRQKVLNRAAGNWNKEFLRTTDKGMARIRQAACTGVKCDLMDTTWAAECLLRVGESSEFLGMWINSGVIHGQRGEERDK